MMAANIQALSDDKRKLDILFSISKSLGAQIQLDQLLKVMVAEVTAAMQAERSSLLLFDEARGELLSKVAEGMQTREIRVPLGVGIAGQCAERRQTINIPDAYQDPRFNPAVDKASGFHTRSILSMPIIDQGNKLIGVVQVLNKIGQPSFTQDDELFLQAICVHLALALERAALVEAYVRSQKLEQALQLAHEIQMGLVPKKFPAFPTHPEIDIYAMLKPALDVGGDLYDFFLLDEDRVCFVIGDVSDKGIPAALFMAMVRTAFKMAAISGRSISNTVRMVNRFIYENNESQMFVTLFAGILDLRTGHVEYSDGGHEPPFITRLGKNIEMLEKKGGVALGFLDDFEFPTGTFELGCGDSLILYTDGVNEAMNIDNHMYRTPTIGTTLTPLCQNGASAKEMGICLMQSVSEWVGRAPQSDDITIVVLRFCGR